MKMDNWKIEKGDRRGIVKAIVDNHVAISDPSNTEHRTYGVSMRPEPDLASMSETVPKIISLLRI
jgi:hypothetical protein